MTPEEINRIERYYFEKIKEAFEENGMTFLKTICSAFPIKDTLEGCNEVLKKLQPISVLESTSFVILLMKIRTLITFFGMEIVFRLRGQNLKKS